MNKHRRPRIVMKPPSTILRILILVLALWRLDVRVVAPDSATPTPALARMIRGYCLDCHDADAAKGELNLEAVLGKPINPHSDVWEKVVRRLATRQMPPAKESTRPSEAEYAAAIDSLTKPLDATALDHPKPGRVEAIRRLNRTEYQNAIRDLLALEIDAAGLLPRDDASHGFDNVTVGTLSPTLLDRYITAAQKISRLAVGSRLRVPAGETVRIKPDLTQEERLEGLPLGTRGGALIGHTFPRSGDYEITIRLSRDRNDEVEGLREPHTLVVLLDREVVKEFIVTPPAEGEGHNDIDRHLTYRLEAKAGPRQLGVTFLKNPSSLLEYRRQPYEAHFNYHRHPRLGPAVYQVSITGPFDDAGPGDTPSRKQIFSNLPNIADNHEDSALKILSTLMRRAYRRPVTDLEIERVLHFFRDAQKDGGFEGGLEAALSAVLVSPEFLFRVERAPKDLASGHVYRISEFDLASRLSFFLWSSIPDDELLDVAERGELAKPEVLREQARRLLANERAESLVSNFAAQWLHLRNLASTTPDARLFPDFDENLRQALRRETELQLTEILREDRSVLTLLKSDHTYLNERLAKHYGIPHIYGTHFRRVRLDPNGQRGGLLRHGSVLTVTSYATRTSPVIRGKWILENLIGTPPPPPAPNVPALDDNSVAANLPVRARLAAHRNHPACISCHEFIDPPGFALEHFDAVGRWRDLEADVPVDASGGLPDGRTFVGVEGLEAGLLERPEIFVTALTEKLLTFALGRGIEPSDGPAIRKIVRQAQAEDYRLSAIIVGLVESVPFTLRQIQ